MNYYLNDLYSYSSSYGYLNILRIQDAQHVRRQEACEAKELQGEDVVQLLSHARDATGETSRPQNTLEKAPFILRKSN